MNKRIYNKYKKYISPEEYYNIITKKKNKNILFLILDIKS